MAEWYVLLANNVQEGPLTEEQVRALVLREGRATTKSNAWRQGMESWQPLESIETFKDLAGGEGWDALRSTLERGKRGAMRTMRAAKIKMQVAKLRRDRERLVGALGEAVYAQRDRLALDEPLQAKANEVTACENEIEVLNAELQSLGEPE